jgi:hypothetical protein
MGVGLEAAGWTSESRVPLAMCLMVSLRTPKSLNLYATSACTPNLDLLNAIVL